MLLNSREDKWHRPKAKLLSVPKVEDFKPEDFHLFEEAYDQYLFTTSNHAQFMAIKVKCETYGQFPERDDEGGYVYDPVTGDMKTTWKAIHQEAQRCWACSHVTPQLNHDKPCGIVMSLGYYACLDCYKLIETHKFKFEHELKTACHACVQMVHDHIAKIDPSKIIIRRKAGGLGQGKG